MTELFQRDGIDTIRACIEEIWNQSEKLARLAVAAVVREGYISAEKAAEYGVVLIPFTGQGDLKATETLRSRLREEEFGPMRNS